jgi:DNA-binding transcriptional ArsR family regulator
MTKYEPDLSLIFHALSDPTRRAMLLSLGDGPQPMAKLAAPTGFALPTVQRHLAVLEEAGLITTQKQGRTRICTARGDAMQVGADWLMETRAKMQAQTDRLGQYLDSLFKDIA